MSIKYFLSMLVILVSFGISFGAVCNSTDSGYWDNSSIWDCGASPSGEDIVNIINHTMTIRNNAEAGNITLGNDSALKIESGYNLQVDYILLLNYSQLNISAGSNISFKDVSYAQLYLNHSSKLHLLGNTTDKVILKSVSETPTNYWKLEQVSQDSLFYVRNGEIRQKAYSGAYGYIDWINLSIIKCSGNIFYHQTWWAPINLENIFINCSGQLLLDYSRENYPIIYKNLTIYNGTDGLGTINLNYYPYIEFINSTFNESKVSGWFDGIFISKNHKNIEGNYLMYIGFNNAFSTKRITNKPTLDDNITIMRNRVKTGNYHYNLTINDSIQGKNINISDTGINITISDNQMLYASENITKAASSFIAVVNGTIKNIVINSTKFTANGTGFILYDVLDIPADKDTYRNVSVWINATNSTPDAIMTINATYNFSADGGYSEDNMQWFLYNGSDWIYAGNNSLLDKDNDWAYATLNVSEGVYALLLIPHIEINSFLGNNENESKIGIGNSLGEPYEINFTVNITNSSSASVNLTHNGICENADDPIQMTYNESTGTFVAQCWVNKTELNNHNSPFNITAKAYIIANDSYYDEVNYTIYFDFERPKLDYNWWNTKDSNGTNITLIDPLSIYDGQDIFFSPNETLVKFKINLTDNGGIDKVYINTSLIRDFTSLLSENGTCDDNELNEMVPDGEGYYVWNCTIGNFSLSDIQNYKELHNNTPLFTIVANDTFGNTLALYNTSATPGTECTTNDPECTSVSVPIVFYDVGFVGPTSPDELHEIIEERRGCDWEANNCTEGIDYNKIELCLLFDENQTTNFNTEYNFSNINLKLGMRINLSCLNEALGLNYSVTLPSDFETMMIMNFTGLNFNDFETMEKLSRLPDAIKINITLPRTFDASSIYVNTSLFEALNASATIKFLHLPFVSQPNVTHVGGNLPITIEEWNAINDNFWGGRIAGNLTFTVNGFSGYQIFDNISPIVSIDYPSNGAKLSSKSINLNISFNGTGTEMSNMLVYLNGTLAFNYTNSKDRCYNVSLGSEEWYCNITLNNLSEGANNINVVGYDFGGGNYPGNNNSKSVTIYVDTSAPIISNVTLVNLSYEAAIITFNTDDNSTCFIEYGKTTSLGNKSANDTYSKTHGIALTDLDNGTLYYYRINCTNEYNLSGVSNNYSFTTVKLVSVDFNESTPNKVEFNFTENGSSTKFVELNVSTTSNVSADISVNKLNTNPVNTNISNSVSNVKDTYIFAQIESKELNSSTLGWAIIKIYYNESEISKLGLNENYLKLYYFNNTSSKWELVPGGVDTTNNYVWGNTTHFSIYSIGGEVVSNESKEPTSPSTSTTTTISWKTYNMTGNTFYETIHVNDIVSIKIGNESYQIKLTSAILDKATFLVRFNSVYVTISKGETKEIDLNNDGKNDISIYVESANLGNAKIKISLLGVTEEVKPSQQAELPSEKGTPTTTQETTTQGITEVSEKTGKVPYLTWIIVISSVALLGIIAYLIYLKLKE